MSSFSIVVIGASMGGVEALSGLAARLPPDIAAAIFVVQHIGRNGSQLPELLDRAGPLPAAQAAQGSVIRPGRIYVAPADYHLLLEPGRMRLSRGPRENWARPAIDPLFRSAAQAYGPQVIGVILTGLLNDGSAGLRAVRGAGGTAVVQEPGEALASDMPWSALRYAGADHRVPLAEIPGLLGRLSRQLSADTEETPSDLRWRVKP